MSDTTVASTERVGVGLDYESEQPWVWTVGASSPDVDGDCEGNSSWFAVDVPAELVERFRLAQIAFEDAITAIHEAAGYDRENQRLAVCCPSWVGEPFHTSDGRTLYDDCDRCGWDRDEHRAGDERG